MHQERGECKTKGFQFSLALHITVINVPLTNAALCPLLPDSYDGANPKEKQPYPPGINTV